MIRDLLIRNRSYRGFDEGRRISRDEMIELVDLTRFTPSSANRQPLKYYIATEKEEVESILPHTGWAALLKPVALPKEGKHPAAFVVICQDTGIVGNLQQYKYDAGIAAEAMLLGATENGLGGCMLGNYDEVALKKLLGIGEELVIQLVVAFGKPAEEIILEEVKSHDGSPADVKYYRKDDSDRHFVPKRTLEDIIL